MNKKKSLLRVAAAVLCVLIVFVLFLLLPTGGILPGHDSSVEMHR